MKKTILILMTVFTAAAQAQEFKQVPQITVSGEGKIKVTPDYAIISIGVENTGADAAEVKKKNDATVDAVIKYLKGFKLPASDYQTKQVYLHKNYDYTKKKYSYVASQQISITLKDLSKYDTMMMGLVDTGINNIQGVEFKSTKVAQFESDARKAAVADAKTKALDYASALSQKVGKAIMVSDNSQTHYPVPMMYAMKAGAAEDAMPRETLAIGEIEITANVTISFSLE
ncbi:26 kDa periplasmic immunogenic protein precursor [compost metagenome]|uniref:SIMPL domain-containing protein n=1 Tax=unclassified Flavobacterium TaxID=196869 RepID=UPI000FB202B0|nr:MULTISPECIES: SIMPL domain-containing protein [unclassified Flavobacterium]WDO12427.1 SIMPL domain-containing protein [Flavobacterium sp. WW92]